MKKSTQQPLLKMGQTASVDGTGHHPVKERMGIENAAYCGLIARICDVLHLKLDKNDSDMFSARMIAVRQWIAGIQEGTVEPEQKHKRKPTKKYLRENPAF